MSLKTSIAKNEIVQNATESDVKPMPKVVRQDRIDVSDLDVWLKTDGEKYEVIDCSSFGLAIHCNHDFSSAVGANVSGSIVFADRSLDSIKLRKVRHEQLGDKSYKVAFEIVSNPISVEQINALRLFNSVVSTIETKNAEYCDVPEAFRFHTLEVCDQLEVLSRIMNDIEARTKPTSIEEAKVIEETLIELMIGFFRERLDSSSHLLKQALANCSNETIKKAYQYFREKAGNTLYQAPFSDRSYRKPLGYAGDFEMMNMIYRNESLGESLFGRALHRYMVAMPGGQAVRNRIRYLNQKILATVTHSKKKTIKILSVASGPAREIQNLFLDADQHKYIENLEVHLLDQDLQSLKHAQKQLKELSWKTGINVSLKLIHKTIKKVIQDGLDDHDYDLIYSAGLFDYFTDPVAQMAGTRLFNSLSKNGSLVIGNFDITSPSRFFMELAWDWNLIHRSSDDMKQLFTHLSKEIFVESEDEKVNLFCNIVKL